MYIPLLVSLLPLLITASPIPGLLLTKDGSIAIVNREAISDTPSITLAPEAPEKRQSSATRNDLVNGICRKVTVIFARGTTEAGNVGLIVGPPFFNALNTALGASNVAVQGVDYPADVPGFLAGGSASGAATMASLASRAASQCPQTQIVMSGYSQGAQLVSLATAQLPSSVINRINAVVLFGNPNGEKPVPNIPAAKTKIFCDPADLICAGTAIILPAHLSYGADAGAAAAFVQSKVSV